MSGEDCESLDKGDSDGQKPDKMFTLKKWNAVAMWSWDVECDTCAICRVQVMDVHCWMNISCMDHHRAQSCATCFQQYSSIAGIKTSKYYMRSMRLKGQVS